MRTTDTLDQSQPVINQATEIAEHLKYEHQVLVFKTNVQYDEQAEKLVESLNHLHPNCRINFDLTDCDRILRLAGNSASAQSVISFMISEGFTCEMLK